MMAYVFTFVCSCVCLSICTGSGGHHHSGLVHRDNVCCCSHRAHPTHRLLHQEEPRGEIPRYSGDTLYYITLLYNVHEQHTVSDFTVYFALISVREKKDISLEPVDDKDQEGSFDYR